MKPAPFTYHAPRSTAELLDSVGGLEGEVRVLAGGQSLMPLLAARTVHARHLVDLNGIDELDFITDAEGALAIGARVRQSQALASSEVAGRQPLLRDALATVASSTVRNRGTVCGSLAFANPSGQLPAVAIATEATLVALSPSGERWIDAADFFPEAGGTSLEAGEILREVRFPALPPGSAHSFQAVKRMRWPVLNVAAIVSVADGEVASASIAVSGVGPAPLRVRAAEEAVLGEPIGGEALAAAGRAVADQVTHQGDLYGSTRYRRHVAAVLVGRALTEAAERAEAEEE